MLTDSLCAWPLLFAVLALACSGTEDAPAEGTPRALQVCKFAGEASCGLTEDGKGEALLLCEVTEEYGRVWMLQEACVDKCEAGACVVVEVPDGGELTVADVLPDVEEDLPPRCEPQCDGKECGDDGCGGNCGLCPADHKCGDDFSCTLHCEPKCTNKQCGDDGCGGSCGDCPFGMACEAGLCACNPQCDGKDCGPDGCGGQCGKCSTGFQCSPYGLCEELCQPACEGKECGPDGCGETCGACPPGLYCDPDGLCGDICYPDCTNKQCGSDGCFGTCGSCPCPTCTSDQTECSGEGQCIVSQAGGGCYELVVCLGDCPTGDTTCQTVCFNTASPAAQTMYEDLIDCIVVQCGSSPSDSCVSESLTGMCAGQYTLCMNDL